MTRSRAARSSRLLLPSERVTERVSLGSSYFQPAAVVANVDGEFNHCPALPSAGVVRAVVLTDASAPGMHEADGHLLLI